MFNLGVKPDWKLNPNGKQMMRQGFTLLELLLVICILGVLAALLGPTLSRAKMQGQNTTCISNLRQLGIALQSFVADNDAYPSIIAPTNGDYPGLWVSQLETGGFGKSRPIASFINRGVWRCPAAPLFNPWPPSNGSDEWDSYAYNGWGVAVPNPTNFLGLRGNYIPGEHWIKGYPGYAPVKESEVMAPAEMMAIGDSANGGLYFARYDLPYVDRNGRSSSRHQGRFNVLFCDGHVESPTLEFLFADTTYAALVRWNRDHQPHQDSL